jgi:hypothetical protein
MAFLMNILTAIAPEVAALLASGLVFVLNKATGAIAGWNDWAKRVAFLVFGQIVAALGSVAGLDVSNAETFAASLVALGLFHLGKATAK